MPTTVHTASIVIDDSASVTGSVCLDARILRLFKGGGLWFNPIAGYITIPEDLIVFPSGSRIFGPDLISVGDYDLVVRVGESYYIEGADLHLFAGKGKADSDGSIGRGGSVFARGGDPGTGMVVSPTMSLGAYSSNLNTVIKGRPADSYRYVEIFGDGTDGNRMRFRAVADATGSCFLSWDVGAPSNGSPVGGYDITFHFNPGNTTVAQFEALLTQSMPDSPLQMIEVKTTGSQSNVLQSSDAFGWKQFTGGAVLAPGGFGYIDSGLYPRADARGDARVGTARAYTVVVGHLNNVSSKTEGKRVYNDFVDSYAVRKAVPSSYINVMTADSVGVKFTSVGIGQQQMSFEGNAGRVDLGNFSGFRQMSYAGDYGTSVSGVVTEMSASLTTPGSAVHEHKNGSSRILTGMVSGYDAICDGELLKSGAAISQKQVVVWSGSKKVSPAGTGSVNLTSIAGVSMQTCVGADVDVKVARRGRCYVLCEPGITAGMLVGTSSGSAGRVGPTSPGAGAIVGRACEASSATYTNQVLIDLILG